MQIPYLDKILAGDPLSAEEGLSILQARGAALTAVFAGAHALRERFFGNIASLCSIINAKSGKCGENCSFCAQSSHFQTSSPVYALKSEEEIVAGAYEAQKSGSHCYGIVTSGTSVDTEEEFGIILAALRRIRRETSITPSASLGILTEEKARALAEAGCGTYHHNLETSRSFFPQVCTTHTYEEDVNTVKIAKQAGMKICCGGIFGLGESPAQRVEMAVTLRELNVDSIPLNFLNPVAGTPLENASNLTPMDCLRIIALYRYMLPECHIAVCGGREHNLRELQSWIFMAGANGTMVGNYLTTTGRNVETDMQMFIDMEVQPHAC